jgi:hypothetical protein
VVARDAVEQVRMAFETRNQSLVRDTVALHHLREHHLMGRFGEGDGGGDTVHATALNPLEEVRALVRERGHPDDVVVENRRIEVADGSFRDVAQHRLALEQVVLVIVTNLPRDSGIQENTVLALLVNDTDTRRRALDHLDRKPHFRMLRYL